MNPFVLVDSKDYVEVTFLADVISPSSLFEERMVERGLRDIMLKRLKQVYD